LTIVNYIMLCTSTQTYEYQAIIQNVVSVSKTEQIMRQGFSFMHQITIADYGVVSACYVCTRFVAQQ